MKKLITIIIAILILIAIILGTYKILTMPVSKNIQEKEITIPMGSGAIQIAEILKENNLIKSTTAFRIYVKLNKIEDFQAGTYYLKESMGVKEITEMLQTGIMYDPNQITITYLEGKNINWLANKIEERTNNSKEQVYELLSNETYIDGLIEKYWFIDETIKNTDIYYPLEGYLFPDTYALASKDATVEEIFEKMLTKMDSVLNKYKTEITETQYSVHEILTIASIIEMETMKEEDRKDVSSVIYNRLTNQMAIQSDVTTYYAFKVEMGERDLYQKEIDTYNPYNTRGPNMEGKLPVGPISSVGRASIEAAIKPNDTNYLFFVADKNGKVYFSESNGEHERIIKDLINKGLWLEY